MKDPLQKDSAGVRDDNDTYKVGSSVPEKGFYVCVPCGNKRYFEAGERFTSCLMCFGKERKSFRKGLELWEKCSDGETEQATQ